VERAIRDHLEQSKIDTHRYAFGKKEEHGAI